jgi:hypothetical protein
MVQRARKELKRKVARCNVTEFRYGERYSERLRLKQKKTCNVLRVKQDLELILVNLYNLGVDVLRVNDQVRDSKHTFDKFVYAICKNIINNCHNLCMVIDEELK